jgi:DNA processing protein
MSTAPDAKFLASNFTETEIETANKSLDEALGGEIRFATRFCELYPPMLAQIADAPPVIYYRGSLQTSLAVALVGSRNPSRYGSEVVFKLSREISRLGLTVVSGLARGIDSIAHSSALQFSPSESAFAPTIAVLGSGLREIYPRENLALSAEIVAAGGSIISELPPRASARPHYFPCRNRIISALAEVTVIVEARERSGSLITARTALEQGREVLVVPGKIDSESFRGSNGLLRDGARPFLDITDLFACLSKSKLSGVLSSGREEEGSQIPVRLTVEEAAILSALEMSDEMTVENLSEQTGLPAQLAAASVTSLLLKGFVKELPGARFVRATIREGRSTTNPTW